jgi:hypothetical protein
MTLCSIDGMSIKPHELTFSQFAFGKEVDAISYRCELMISKDYFIEKLKPLYDNGIKELREDDEITGDFEPPYPGATNYPSLPEFVDIKGPYLYEYLYAYHKFDILSFIINEDSDEANYVIKNINSIYSVDGNIVIKGAVIKR